MAETIDVDDYVVVNEVPIAETVEVGASSDLPPVVDEAKTKTVAVADTKKATQTRRTEAQLKEVVNEYIKSGLTVMEFCKEHKEAPPTLVKHLEDAGYRMTLGTAKDPSDLKAENDMLLNNYTKLLQKYEPDKYKMAMLACID